MKLSTNGENLVKSTKGYAPVGRLDAENLVKFSVLGPHNSTPAPIGVKFGVESTLTPPHQISPQLVQRVAPMGRKPQNHPE